MEPVAGEEKPWVSGAAAAADADIIVARGTNDED